MLSLLQESRFEAQKEDQVEQKVIVALSSLSTDRLDEKPVHKTVS